ncbi:hypothetical protein [Paenibacillus sp. YN15]|uniref:hypothetical protein n=1 Tax=Paenibacillus sp. YN15 TaxID=1742774 RepID=UPI000DCD76C6|nr:hypothetical protein [Paenibacillus sp. YN15]RAU96800.1 hypothetical protein DQG13_19785 [Paenibacillus sp. YN15]
MEESKQLNSLVVRYQNGDKAVFGDIYEALAPMRNGWLAKASGRYLDDKATRLASFDDTLCDSLCRYNPDIGRFVGFLADNLRRANAKGYRNRNRKKLTCEVPDDPIYSDDDDGMTLLDTIADANPLPEEVVQKKRDHRQVISILLADQSAEVKRIAEHRPMYKTDNALAKALGVHHTVVKRTWSKIVARYDANRYGPISEYLA